MWKQGDELSSEEGSKRGEWKRDIWNGKKYLRGKNYARERWIHLIQNINIKKLFHFDFNLGSFFIKIDQLAPCSLNIILLYFITYYYDYYCYYSNTYKILILL